VVLLVVKIVMVSGGFVGGEDLLTKGFLQFPNKMAVLVLRTKWPQSEVLQRQLLAHLKTHFPLIFFAQTQLRGSFANKWPQGEVLRKQHLTHLKTYFPLISLLKLNSEVS
jgi:hypothetical protein